MTTTMELVTITPTDAIIDVNVRTKVDLDKAFLESIRTRGILQPPTGWRDDDGLIHIEVGQRRALAAAEVGLDALPVLVKPRHDAEADRLIDQLAENDRREQLSDSEHVAAYEQLSLFGLPADEIAKKTGAKRAVVRQALKLTKEAPEMVAVMREHELTLDQVAEIAEFREHPDLVVSLTDFAKKMPESLPHELGRTRELVRERAEVAQLRAEAEAKGWKFVGPDDEWEQFLSSLPVPEVDPDLVLVELESLLLGEEALTPSPEAAHAQGGLVATVVPRPYWENKTEGTLKLEYWVLNPREHGYTIDDGTAGPRDTSPEEEERLREVDARRAKMAQRQQDWERATKIRREWIRDDLLNDRKKLPADAAQILLEERLGRGPTLPPRWYSPDITHTAALLALPPVPGEISTAAHNMTDDIANQFFKAAEALGPTRVSLALALGRVEGQADRYEPRLAGYLQQLAAWGYGLASIESDLITEATPTTEHETTALAATDTASDTDTEGV
ncbi:MAG: ParB/RepB/Spo0J family partition protein [Hyphomicrobium sp.]|jgi:ParB family chromosome partitioning protein